MHLGRSARNFVNAPGTQTRQSLKMQPADPLMKSDESSLRESEERLRAILTHAVDGIITIDENGMIESMNPAAEKMFGYDAGEITGKSVNLLMPSPYREQHDEYIRNYLSTGQAKIIGIGRETIAQRSDRSIFPIDLTVSEVHLPGRRLFTGFIRDITDRKLAEEALRESEQRFRAMADASPAMIWISGTNKQCVWLNAGWIQFVGRPMDEELGEGWRENVHAADRARCLETYETAFHARMPFDMEYRMRRYDGEFRWILDRGIPIYDPSGNFKGYIGSCVDIHDGHRLREDLEQEVRQRTSQLRETVHELEAFSYSIAHDMRAPLRAIQGYAKILTQDNSEQLNDTGKEYLRRMVQSAHRMDALIQDVLNYSRIARNQMPLESVELEPFIREIVLSYPDFERHRSSVFIESPLSPIRANRAALTQVVSNLLSNAVKFVAPGVTPRVVISTAIEKGRVKLSFQDNGIGIAPESQQRIFQIFARLHRTDEYDGTGIGLAIVRKAAERMGGSVAVESAPGKGSTFHVTLDLPEKP